MLVRGTSTAGATATASGSFRFKRERDVTALAALAVLLPNGAWAGGATDSPATIRTMMIVVALHVVKYRLVKDWLSASIDPGIDVPPTVPLAKSTLFGATVDAARGSTSLAVLAAFSYAFMNPILHGPTHACM